MARRHGCRAQSLSNGLVFRVVQSLRNQYSAAWKRHVIYNIGNWTVTWLKDRLTSELGQVGKQMPSWQRTKLA